MSGDPGPVFVERRTYRRRRLVDAARLLPVLGALLLSLPLLWAGSDAAPMPTSHVMIYLFGVWLLLTVLAGVVSRHLRRDDSGDGPSGSA